MPIIRVRVSEQASAVVAHLLLSPFEWWAPLAGAKPLKIGPGEIFKAGLLKGVVLLCSPPYAR